MRPKYTLSFLLILLGIKAVFLLSLIVWGEIHLAPDEAQYWTWSQALDWGYYSKPPAIAWQIFATTSLFGNTELGVRFGAVLIGFCLPLAVYWLARKTEQTPQVTFWAALVMAFSPLGFYLSFAATTDAGAILFLTLGLAALVQKEGPHYLLAGCMLFLGALYKWTAFVLWPFALVYLLFVPSFRRWSLLGGILIALVALLPMIYWNQGHEWATFRHVGKTLISAAAKGNFFDFLGAQIGLLSPVFFILLVLSFCFLARSKQKALYLLACFPAVMGLLLIVSLFKKMQPNWGAFLYPPGMVLIAWAGCEQLKRLWLHIGVWVSIATVVIGVTIPSIQSHNLLPIPYRVNPFRQSVGWTHLTTALEEAGYSSGEAFLFGDKYQTASLLSFYGPGQKRAYFFNVSGTRKNQFSYWPQMDEKEIGRTGFFAVLENTTEASSNWYKQHYLERLGPFFEKIEYQGAYPLFYAEGKPVKYAFLFKCTNFLGSSSQHSLEAEAF